MGKRLGFAGRGIGGIGVLGATLALLPGVMAAPGEAQVAPPPVIAPPPPPIVAVPPAAPLPQLTDAQAQQLVTLLMDDAVAQGLRATPDRKLRELNRDDLVRAALDHARAVRGGRLDASDFQADWGLRPPSYDPVPAFADAVRRNRLAPWISSLRPPYVGYDTLRKGLAAYRQLAASGGWRALPEGPDITTGATGAQVTALRARLAVEDQAVATQGDRFDADLLEAVRRAQRRYGLNPTGVVAGQTRAALNMSVEDRIHQIMANMERWRWLPATLPQRRVQVNIAAAVLTVFEGDAPVLSMRAVTGRPGDETPMLESRIHSIVINPPWNVPSSIATRELWPREQRDPGYLRRNNFKVISTEGGGRRLQQAAGTSSALGRFKFDFDNRFAVYLHDTPSQATFARYSRLASHGCVRLERPAELAELLLRGDPTWTDSAITAAVDKGDTVRARLGESVSVYLLYWTAFANANGQMSFRADPYDWDGRLATKIETRSARQAAAVEQES